MNHFLAKITIYLVMLCLFTCTAITASIGLTGNEITSVETMQGHSRTPCTSGLLAAPRVLTEDIDLEGIEFIPVVLDEPGTDNIAANQTDYWLVEGLDGGTLVYFNINFLTVVMDYNLTIFRRVDSLHGVTIDEEAVTLQNSTYEILGSFQIDENGDYILALQASLGGNYSILLKQLTSGYSYDTAAVLEPGFSITHEVLVKQQLFYWRIDLDSNQRGEITIIGITEGILLSSNLTIYNRPDDSLLPPQTVDNDGNIYITWKRLESSVNTDFYALLSRPITNPVGTFNVTLTTQKIAYNFTNAIELEINQTRITEVVYVDQFQEETFFLLHIEHPGVNVDFWLEEVEKDSNILEDASIYIYDATSEIQENREAGSLVDGTISGFFRATYEGYYYIKVLPRNVGAPKTASYSIRFSYPVPGVYLLHDTDILISLAVLSLVPLLYMLNRFFLVSKNTGVIFTVNHPVKTVFSRFIDNPRFSRVRTVPDKHIIVEQNRFTGGFRMDFQPFDEETSIRTWRQIRKIEVFGAVLIAWLVYSGFNLIIYSQNYRTLLPWSFTTTVDVIVFHLGWTVMILACYVFVTVYPGHVFRTFVKEIEITVNEFEKRSTEERVLPVVDEEFIQRNMNYIRVLWNQARKSFNKKDFGTFLIKADSSVKKLVELRFLQLYKGNNLAGETLSFSQVITRIRESGFDIPPDRKIEHYRHLRNKVVHGSLLPDENTAIDTFAFYAKFLSRLGLRT